LSIQGETGATDLHIVLFSFYEFQEKQHREWGIVMGINGNDIYAKSLTP